MGTFQVYNVRTDGGLGTASEVTVSQSQWETMATACAGTQRMYFPAGTYVLTGVDNGLRTNLSIIGDGNGLTVFKIDNRWTGATYATLNGTGTQAVLQVIVSYNSSTNKTYISAIKVLNQGTYSVAPTTVTITGGGTGATATVQTSGTSPNIKVTGITVTNGGQNYPYTNNVFKAIGSSNVSIEDIKFVSDNLRQMDCLFRINSYGADSTTACYNHSYKNLQFENIWTNNVFLFGNTSLGETHFLDGLYIERCYFKNIYDPSYPIVWNTTDPKSDAINLAQTTRRCRITECEFINISGHGIFQWGWTQTSGTPITPIPKYGNTEIDHCYFERNWIFVEVNGGGLGRNLRIHDNIGFDWTSDDFYALTLANYNGRTYDNNWTGFDRICYELRGVDCDWNRGDLITIKPYTTGSGGTPRATKAGYIPVVEMYGFNNKLHGKYRLERTGTLHVNTPDGYLGIKFVGKHTESDPNAQPSSWDNLTDFAGNFILSDLEIDGYDAKAIFAENVPGGIRNVDITSTVICRSNRCVGDVILKYGYDWNILCKIDNGGSPTIPKDGNGIRYYGSVNVKDTQVAAGRPTGGIIAPLIIGTEWGIKTSQLQVINNLHCYNSVPTT